MSLVEASSPAGRPSWDGGVAIPLGPPADGPPLLPEPAEDPVPTMDSLSMIYLFESRDQQLGVEQGTSQIQGLQSERQQAFQKELDAIKQEDAAAQHHSFWDTLGSICGEVAKVAAVVASVAAAVATCGAATPLAALAVAGAVLSSASFVDGEFHVLRSLGVDDKTAGLIDTGMAVGGMVTSVGAGLLGGGRAAASALTSIVQGSSAAVTVATSVVGGVSAIERGEAQAQADSAATDEVAAEARQNSLTRRVQAVIDQTQSSDQQSQQILQTIATTRSVQDQTSVDAAAAVKGSTS